MSNEVETLNDLYAVYNTKTHKFALNGATYTKVGAAKNSWNAHTRYRDLYPHADVPFWKRAKWSEDAENYGFVVVKVKLVITDEI